MDPTDFDGNDTDSNGYIDDIRGYDIYEGDADPMDPLGHGTHCAGTIAAVRHSLKGIEVTDETIDLDTIMNVGPGGHFMSQESTRKRIRTAVWIPELFTRDYRTDWEKKGWKDLFKMACEKVDNILAHHKPEPLDKDIAKDIREIVKEADKELT